MVFWSSAMGKAELKAHVRSLGSMTNVGQGTVYLAPKASTFT
jgi:hypothetical protein